jgi:hypothetical protein
MILTRKLREPQMPKTISEVRGVIVLVAICALCASSFAQAKPEPLSSLYGGEVNRPQVAQELDGGFWRTDVGFEATLKITNVVENSNIDVIPVIYLADGTEYQLPMIKVAEASTVAVDINRALREAPPAIGSHVSSYGSVAVRFQWGWREAIRAAVKNIDQRVS